MHCRSGTKCRIIACNQAYDFAQLGLPPHLRRRACAGSRTEAVIRARGGRPLVVHTSTWGGTGALARLKAHNAEMRHLRARIEKVFGTR